MKYTREQIEGAADYLHSENNAYFAEMLRQLLAENDALREDAERYQWLRSSATGDSTLWDAVTDYGGQYSMKCMDELDEAIDAAMQSANKGE